MSRDPREFVLAKDSQPGNGYTLIHWIGSGGFGEVWKAQSPTGDFHAIKFIDSKRSQGQFHAAEQRAAEWIKDIRHPHLIPIYSYWRVGDYLAIAMELADCSLDKLAENYIQAGYPGIPREQLIQYLEGVAAALDYLHKPQHFIADMAGQKLAHRDIKPANLFLVKQVKNGTTQDVVKIGDFGLTRKYENEYTTHTGHMSHDYAAPEVIKKKMSVHSDQYSLAITYMKLLTGKLPFDGDPIQIALAHNSERPDLSSLPETDRKIVARALDKVPEKRWPNCMALVAALRSAGGHTVFSSERDSGRSVVPMNLPNYTYRTGISETQRANRDLTPRQTPDTPSPDDRNSIKPGRRLPYIVAFLSSVIAIICLCVLLIQQKAEPGGIKIVPDPPKKNEPNGGTKDVPESPLVPRIPESTKPDYLAFPTDKDQVGKIQKDWADYYKVKIQDTINPKSNNPISLRFVPPPDPKLNPKITGPYYIGTYEFTRAQYDKFVKQTSYKSRGDIPACWDTNHKRGIYSEIYDYDNTGFPQEANHPVILVSHRDAMACCQWLTESTGWDVRLLTEAEWEHAAKAGSTKKYILVDDHKEDPQCGNIADQSLKSSFEQLVNKNFVLSEAEDHHPYTAPVGSFTPNALGLYDMIGNVAEWCSDDCGNANYPVRGGEWGSQPGEAGIDSRIAICERARLDGVGFRIFCLPKDRDPTKWQAAQVRPQSKFLARLFPDPQRVFGVIVPR